MEKKENLLELDLRDINEEWLNNKLYRVRNYTERLNSKQYEDIFLGIRNNRLTFYYMGRELMTIEFENKENFNIVTRKEFGSREDLNQRLKDLVENIPLIQNYNKVNKKINTESVVKDRGRYTISNKDFDGYARKTICEYLLAGLKDLLDDYYGKEIKKELPVQGLYTTTYNDINKELYIIDMEFILPQKFKKQLDNPKIAGRYDMLGLHKVKDKYKLVFIELKVNKPACISNKSAKTKSCGINNHIIDMENFLTEYNKNGKLKKAMKENILRIIDIKEDFKLIDKVKLNDDCFDNPEFWILMDMKDNIEVKSIEDIENIIKDKDGKLIKEMKAAKLKFYKGDVTKRLLQELY